jgi:hypothetical protein
MKDQNQGSTSEVGLLRKIAKDAEKRCRNLVVKVFFFFYLRPVHVKGVRKQRLGRMKPAQLRLVFSPLSMLQP